MNLGNQWSKVLLPRLNQTDIKTLVLLIVAGGAGNYFRLSMFFGIDFLFGSIAVWLVVLLYGGRWGTLAALIISLPTVFFWGHPYAVIILTVEAGFVGCLWRPRQRNLVLLDGIYWLGLGVPLIGLFYAGVMQMAPLQVGLILLKQPVNGIFNALIANLIVAYLPIHRWAGRPQPAHNLTLQQVLLNLLLAFAVLPLLLLTILKDQWAFKEMESQVNADLTAISTELTAEVRQVQQERLGGLQKLAHLARESQLQPSDELDQSTEVLRERFPDVGQVYIANANGQIIASDPPLNARGDSTPIEQATTCSAENLFILDPSSYILQMRVPILEGARIQGCVVAEIDLNDLRERLQFYQKQPDWNLSLLDAQGQLVTSTHHQEGEWSILHPPEFVLDHSIESTTNHWLPRACNKPLIVRWQQSFYGQRQPIGGNIPWTLVVEVPAAPYIEPLQRQYIVDLVTILLIAALALFLSHFLSRRLVNPLSRLALVTTNLPDKLLNHLEVSWPHSAIAEMNSLVRNFQLMAGTLQQKFRELQEINDTLEQRVRSRTQELSQTNQELEAEIAQRARTEVALRETTEALENFSASLKHLHRISTASYDNCDDLFADYLEAGCEILGLETGMIGRIANQSYIIRSVKSELECLEPGLEFALEDAYCIAVVRGKKTITYTHVGEMAQMQSHPLYQRLKLESYISTPIFANGEIYGTLCFCSTQVRSADFDPHEREIIELMARSIGRYIAEHRAKEELQRQYQRAQLLAEVTLKIRQSLQLEEILSTAVTEVQKLLQADRILIVQLHGNFAGTVVEEAAFPGGPALLGRAIAEPLLPTDYIEKYCQGRITASADLQQAITHPEDRELLQQFAVKASLIVPIFVQEKLWGLLVNHQCQNPRQWNDFEIELSKQLADQIGIALSQAQLLEHLEELVAERTVELTTANRQLQQEIKDRQRAEKALRRREEQLRLITDALPALIAYVDFQQRYRFNNQAYEDWFGHSPAEIYGRHIQEVLGETAYQQMRKYVETALSGQKVSFEMELPYKDSNTRWLSAVYIPHLEEQGEVKGYIALSGDITERKAIERMKDEFISVVSHELRTPLTSIHGSLKLLATGRLGNLSADGQQMLKIADVNTERLVRLVNDILELQRIGSGKVKMDRRLCDAADLMVKAKEAMEGMAQQQGITLSLTPAAIPLWADPDYIIQILTNLLSNAIKFSSPGNTVWIAVEDQGNEVLFQVKDQGRGIPADKLESIFGRFQQVDASDSRQKGGTGLGLSICRQIVELHGGKIWAESPPGKGSTFYFTLPVVKEVTEM